MNISYGVIVRDIRVKDGVDLPHAGQPVEVLWMEKQETKRIIPASVLSVDTQNRTYNMVMYTEELSQYC